MLSKHKNRHRASDSEEGGLEDWLMTYADMITLLMCFFFIIAAVSKPDVGLFEKMRAGVTKEVGKNAIVTTPILEIKKALDTKLAAEKQKKMVAIVLNENGIELSFASSTLYQIGKADIGPAAQDMMKKVVSAIGDVQNYPFQIDVEGHTDNVPIKTPQFQSNWELSAARAINIVRYMIGQKMDPLRLKAAGYADTRPLVPNIDAKGIAIPDNQSKNRRILIRIH
jgi:chemotaxis protein MotB